MPRMGTLAIAMAALGVLSGMPLTGARACDNDRYPCPVVSQTEDAAGVAARSPAPARKKASRAARQDEKPRAKTEGEASRASSGTTNPILPGQEQKSVSGPQKSEDPAPATNEVAREEPPVAAPSGAAAQATGGDDAAPVAAANEPPIAAANEVRVVDPNELNELDVAAASAAPAGSAGSSWLSYLLMTLGGALAAASTLRFLFFV
jgi:hypothetical protein